LTRSVGVLDSAVLVTEPLQVALERRDSPHGDLFIVVGSWVHRGDSYYFLLDDHAAQPPSAVASIIAMLRQWERSIRAAEVGRPFYLPYDFSDQSTGWLRCLLAEEDSIELTPGWSRVEGHAFFPSDFLATAAALDDFEALAAAAPFRLSRAEALRCVEVSIVGLERPSRARVLTSEARAAHQRRVAQMNALSRAVANNLRAHGITCPHCAETRRDHRFLDSGRGRAAYFVCVACGRSFTADDMG
jgi:hypothetical protein